MSAPALNSDFVPQWMAELGIRPGEWLNMSKPQLRVMQRPDKPLKLQVWATGMLHSSGYQGQEALTMRQGKKVPLTPGDIITELHRAAKLYYTKGGIKLDEKQVEALREAKEDIRHVMVELESEGVALRTDGKRRPLRDLSPDELKRLPSGRTRMYFWLTPKDPDPEIVRREWERLQPPEPDSDDDMSKVEVGMWRLPLPRIRQILNALKIALPQKAEIATPEYQIKVEAAYLAARKVFIEQMEVGMGSLPQEPVEVGAAVPPEVGATGGALESKAERKPLEAGRRAPEPLPIEKTHPSGGRASSGVVEGTTSNKPPARPPVKTPEQTAKPEEPAWHTEVRVILDALPIGVPVDEPMFQRIAAVLREELLEQFKDEAGKATGIRKWSGYLSIAKQVAERGVAPKVATAAAGGGEQTGSFFERQSRRVLEKRAKDKESNG